MVWHLRPSAAQTLSRRRRDPHNNRGLAPPADALGRRRRAAGGGCTSSRRPQAVDGGWRGWMHLRHARRPRADAHAGIQAGTTRGTAVALTPRTHAPGASFVTNAWSAPCWTPCSPLIVPSAKQRDQVQNSDRSQWYDGLARGIARTRYISSLWILHPFFCSNAANRLTNSGMSKYRGCTYTASTSRANSSGP